MAVAIHTTRRRMFAGGVLAVALPAVASASNVHTLRSEMRAIRALGEIANDGPDPHGVVLDEWLRRYDSVLDTIEALPSTLENTRLKAEAVLLIHHEGAESINEDCSCTSSRLIRQIVAALAGAHW